MYGQYSTQFHGTKTKAKILASRSPDAPAVTKSRMYGAATVAYDDAAGAQHLRYHETDVVSWLPDGSIRLNSGGWRTMTTLRRMNEVLKRYAINVRTGWEHSERGFWIVSHHGNRHYFKDGIVLRPDGTVKGAMTPAQIERSRRWRLKVAKFCGQVKALPILPIPSGGDCWVCCMRTADGKPVFGSGPSHLIQHVKENYLHGSLIVNAMRAKGWQDVMIRMTLEGGTDSRGIGDRHLAARALRTYLTDASYKAGLL